MIQMVAAKTGDKTAPCSRVESSRQRPYQPRQTTNLPSGPWTPFSFSNLLCYHPGARSWHKPMFSTILVPLDGTPESNAALPAACVVARVARPSIWFLRVARYAHLSPDH
jgi:hypothetical protein